MVLYNDKILLLLTPLTQIGIYLNPHINFLSSFFFFLHEWSFRSDETNESADRETASF